MSRWGAHYHGWLVRLTMAGSCARLLNYYCNSIESTQLVLVVASDSESIGPGLARKVLRLHSGRPSDVREAKVRNPDLILPTCS